MIKKISFEIEVCEGTEDFLIEGNLRKWIRDNFQKPETSKIKIEDIKND